MKIKIKEKKSFLEGACIEDILGLYKTPLYLYSQKKISDAYKNLKNNLNSEIFYSIKANSNQAILSLIKNCGAGADVVSIGELKRALSAGFKADKIILEGVGKATEDIEYAIHKNIRLINAESINELITINEISKNLNKQVSIGIRFNPDIDGNTIDKISTGKKTDKFGISLEKLHEVILLIKNLKYIKLEGISCHIGSQINDIKIYEKVFTAMKTTASIITSNNINLKHIDLGGGFFVNYKKDEGDSDLASIGSLVNSIFKNVSYNISFEPGRYLVAKSGVLITKILTTKKNGGINFLITDAGMQTLIRPALYGSFHRIEPLNNYSVNNIKYTIAGPICESSDILAKNITLSEQKTDDYLLIHDVGAYGSAMASNYNSRPPPSEILVHEDKYAIIYQEEDISEIIKRDVVPKWL